MAVVSPRCEVFGSFLYRTQSLILCCNLFFLLFWSFYPGNHGPRLTLFVLFYNCNVIQNNLNSISLLKFFSCYARFFFDLSNCMFLHLVIFHTLYLYLNCFCFLWNVFKFKTSKLCWETYCSYNVNYLQLLILIYFS